MGDMADAFLESVMDFEEMRENYRAGQMSDLEAYEAGIIDEDGSYHDGRSRSRTCRCCKKTGLLWGKVGGKWRLFEGKKIHNCPVRRLKDG